MTVLPVYGGASRHHQVDELAKGVEIVVATPLRLIDLVKSGEVELGECQIVTLDEADRMADDGFTPQVEWILRHCTGRNQTMLFSATLDGDVGHLIRHYQTDPETVAIDEATDTVGTMHHLFLAVHHMDKDKVIGSISKSIPQVLVFCQTKRVCDRVATNLADLGVDASPLHGDMQQSARERVLRKFAEGKLSILVATDVAARGIDIDDIGAVLHYEPAKDVKDYLHRSGRTARAGKDGWAVTLVEYNQHTQMRILQRGMRLPNDKPVEVFSNDVRLLNLASFHADYETEIPVALSKTDAVAAQNRFAARNMPSAEVEITVDLVRALLDEQFPDLATLPVTPVANGWDNSIYRLGDDLLVRMPRRQLGADLVEHEHRWLPELARRLPIPIPAPVHAGRPGSGYPWSWSICPWFEGAVAADVGLDRPDVPRPSASASSSPRCIDRRRPMRRTTSSDAASRSPSSSPDRSQPRRARAHRPRSFGTRPRAHRARSRGRATGLRRARRRRPSGTVRRCGCTATCTRRTSSSPTVSIRAVIDFGDITSGDPAVDLAVAWMLFDDTDRAVFRDAAGGGLRRRCFRADRRRHVATRPTLGPPLRPAVPPALRRQRTLQTHGNGAPRYGDRMTNLATAITDCANDTWDTIVPVMHEYIASRTCRWRSTRSGAPTATWPKR